MKVYKNKFLLVIGLLVLVDHQVFSTVQQVLYSINMPANPFQQPYYQMMIKGDNPNTVATISPSTTNSQLGNEFTSSSFSINQASAAETFINTDYGALYWDGSYGTYLYGMSPYKVRGYMEGCADALYVQRPAQVNLPFSFTQQSTATFPDYTDAFLAFTAQNVYDSTHCSEQNSCPSGSTCSQQSSCSIFYKKQNQAPCWYTYLPPAVFTGWEQKTFYDSSLEMNTVAYGTYKGVIQGAASVYPYALTSLAQGFPYGLNVYTVGTGGVNVNTGYAQGFTPVPSGSFMSNVGQTNPSKLYGWSSVAGFSINSYANSLRTGYMTELVTDTINQNTAGGVLSLVNYTNSLSDFSLSLVGMPPVSLAFSPVIMPGYDPSNGSNYAADQVATLLPAGDLGGNFSSSKNLFLSIGQVGLYDGTSVSHPISYFQLFAQNMQWFSAAPAALNQTGNKYISPGRGVFSDTLQIAGMELPSVSSAAPVFIGSLGVSSGVTGPLMVSGQATNGNFSVPQAFLTVLDGNSFQQGKYLQNSGNSSWVGALSAQEKPLQYFQGVVPFGFEKSTSLPTYLPLYFADPGIALYEPGWNYCPILDTSDSSNNPLCYNTAQPLMTNFIGTLSGESQIR